MVDDSVDADFSYGEDENEVFEELDSTLMEITDKWYSSIFNKQKARPKK